MESDDEGMDDVEALLRAVDHPVPVVTAESVAARARGRSRMPIRWAAAVLLTLGAGGVAYAVPGSPLRKWVEAVADRLGRRDETPPQAPSPRLAADRGSAGIAVAPGRSLIIAFSARGPDGLVMVSLGDHAEVVVRAPGGAAKFTSEADRLVIEDRGSPDTFAIEIPREARRVEVRAGKRSVFLVKSGKVTTTAAPDAEGVYLIPLRAEKEPP